MKAPAEASEDVVAAASLVSVERKEEGADRLRMVGGAEGPVAVADEAVSDLFGEALEPRIVALDMVGELAMLLNAISISFH